MKDFRSVYGPDRRFLSDQDRAALDTSEGAFQQRSSAETRERQAESEVANQRIAGKYRASRGFAEPNLGGRISISKPVVDGSPFGGTELPSLRGRNYGKPGAGGKSYAKKPKGYFGTFYSY